MSHTFDHKYFIKFVKPNPAEFKRVLITYSMEMPNAERAMANIGYKSEILQLSMHFLLVNNECFIIVQQTLDYQASCSLYTSQCWGTKCTEIYSLPSSSINHNF